MATSLNCAFHASNGFKLGIHSFKLNPGGESIEDKLKLPSSGKQKTKKEMKNESQDEKDKKKGLRKIAENQEKFYNKPLQKVFNMGGGYQQWDVTAAAEMFLKRDYPDIAKISETDGQAGQTGQVFLPQTWLSGVPAVVDMTNWKNKEPLLDNMTLDKKEEMKSDFIKTKGEPAEKCVYEKLSQYFKDKKEEVVLIHSAKILEPDLSKRKGDFEKDFIVINKSKQYFLNVEVKTSLSQQKHQQGKSTIYKSTIDSSLEQVEGSKRLLEDYFGADLTQDWKFIGAVYTESLKLQSSVNCSECNSFIIVGQASIIPQMEAIMKELEKIRPTCTPSPMVYRTVVKHLLFSAHASPAPVTSNMGSRVLKNVEEAGTAENVALWSLWTPAQRSLTEATDLPFVTFISSFSTGKTKASHQNLSAVIIGKTSPH
jgi:hypothetical protein